MIKYFVLAFSVLATCLSIAQTAPHKSSNPKTWTSDSKKRYMWRQEDGLPYLEACSRDPKMRKYYDVKKLAYPNAH